MPSEPRRPVRIAIGMVFLAAVGATICTYALKSPFFPKTVKPVVIEPLLVQISEAESFDGLSKMDGAFDGLTQPPFPDDLLSNLNAQLEFSQPGHVTPLHTLCGNTSGEEGIYALERRTAPRRLNFSFTRITDYEMEHLAKLIDTEWLNLNHTTITDAGLEQLKGLANLSKLTLNDTRTTSAGRDTLRLALPNCRITPEP